MKTIPQSEVENSQMLGSDDFTGEGAQLDLRKVIADGEDDNQDDKNKKGKKSKNEKRGR